MSVVRCPSCGARVKGSGKASAGGTRWRCKACGTSMVGRIDDAAKRPAELLARPLSKARQADMPGGGGTFRRRTSGSWHVWPLPPATGEAPRVVLVGGTCPAGNVAVLVAGSGEHVLGWHVARSGSSAAHRALMARIAPPGAAVTDGGPGLREACREIWPGTRVQRCAPHAFEQVRRYVTTRPRTQAGVDPYALAKGLPGVRTSEGAAAWAASCAGWCATYEESLKGEATDEEGRTLLAHERLVKARNPLTASCAKGRCSPAPTRALWAGSAAFPPRTTRREA